MASNYIDLPANGSPRWKDPVATVASLPSTGNTAGDARVTLDALTIYIWSGSAWIENTASIVVSDTASVDLTVTGGTLSGTVLPAGVDHNSLANLTTGDPHTQYGLLAGRSGGQTLIGGTASGNNLTLQSTSNASRGMIKVNDSLQFTNDTSAIYFNNGTQYYIQADDNSVPGRMIFNTHQQFDFSIDGTPRMYVFLSSGIPQLFIDGDLTFGTDNTRDIGRGGGSASNIRPRNVYIASQLLSADGTAGAPSQSFVSSPSSGMYFNTGETSLNFSTGGTNQWTITSTGVLQARSATSALEMGGGVRIQALTANRLDFLTHSTIQWSVDTNGNMSAQQTGLKVLATGGLGVGNSATASVGVGTIARKMEVFDATGSSLGFVPIYTSIT